MMDNMDFDNIERQNSNEIIGFSHAITIVIGLLIVAWGATLQLNDRFSVISYTVNAVGSTIITIGVINIFYERWRDKKVEKQLNTIPEKVKKEIQNSIEEIVQKHVSKYKPAQPIMIYPESIVPEKNFQEDLITDLLDSENYVYSGVQMTVAAECLKKILRKEDNENGENKKALKLINIHFYLPKPENKILSRSNLEAMKNSLTSIKESLINISEECSQKFTLKFTLLGIYPPFHIHRTDNRIWFASVLLDKNGIPYPTTYLYEKPDKGSVSMFETLNRMMDVLMKDKDENEKIDNCCVNLGAGVIEPEIREASFNVSEGGISFNELVTRIEKRIENLNHNTEIRE